MSKKVKLNYDQTYATQHSRNYYRGKSFHFSGKWVPGAHYVSDDYNLDFVVHGQSLLACAKSHLSTIDNEPTQYTYDDHGNISGVISIYWDFVLGSVTGASPGVKIEDNDWWICNDISVPEDQQVWTNTGVKAKMELSDLSEDEIELLQRPGKEVVENFLSNVIVQTKGNNRDKLMSQDIVTSELTTIDRVTSEHIAGLHEQVQNLIKNQGTLGEATATSLSLSNMLKINDADLILNGSTPPTTVPDFAGEFYNDTNNKLPYVALGNSSTSDWTALATKSSIDSYKTEIAATVTGINNALNTANQKITANTNSISSEATRLEGLINAEARTRQTKDSALEDAIAQEADTRQRNDNLILNKIPEEASSTNKLADKNYVGNAIAQATANMAELDQNGIIITSQLPSYVDDVIEGYLYSGSFYSKPVVDGYLYSGVFYEDAEHTSPITGETDKYYYDLTGEKFYEYASSAYSEVTPITITGETGKIYVDLVTNKTYRWSGSAFVVISETLALGENSSTAYRGDRGKTAYDHATDSSRISSAVNVGFYKIGVTAEGHVGNLVAVEKTDITGFNLGKSDVGLANVDNTSDADKPVSTATQTELGKKADKVSSPTDGNFAGLDSNGNLIDSGHKDSDYATANHVHGNITNDGKLQQNDVTIASGDKLVITDNSDSDKVARASISFDGSTTNKALTPKGTFESFLQSSNHTITVNSGKKSDGTTDISATSSSAFSPSVTLGDSGATAGSYGDSTAQTPGYGNSFKVPYITVNAKGIVVGISDHNVTIPSSDENDTKNTAGSTNTTDKIYLVGAKEQGDNPQTYSNVNCYASGGKLYSNGSEVLTSHQDITGKADKVTSATNNNFASLDSNGNLKDSGHKHSDYKTTQTAKTDPTVPESGTTTAIAFIDSITQNANGEISATKKYVQTATDNQSGVMSSIDHTKLSGIESGAQVNVIEKIQINGTDQTITSKTVNLPAYPTALPASDVSAWAKAANKPSYNLDEVSDGDTRKLSNYKTIDSLKSKGTSSVPVYFDASGDAQSITNLALDGSLSGNAFKVIAEHISELTSRIVALETNLNSLGNVSATSIDIRENITYNGDAYVLIGTGSPAAIPSFVGQFYIDKTNKKLYFAVGTSAVSDWNQA